MGKKAYIQLKQENLVGKRQKQCDKKKRHTQIESGGVKRSSRGEVTKQPDEEAELVHKFTRIK